ncbi:heterokaryon incompatibility [Hyaloscypha variabilis F]|uniref:Heterokaryon incompatibility n=1 Tax=Hyaloscypha variabilis (strain UAMH 11265 / GT02V1 / F) TaxID=1149755 RepID=A0A2J6S248_HYAVF|nr:heterokaryon incompatibility [Hyaloscypha variabilis F]
MAMYHLWVDAICINQKDDVEKATQISLMKEIYSFAEEVVIWLGFSAAERGIDDQSNEKLAIDLIDELTTGDDMDFNSLVRSAIRRDDAEPRWKAWKAFSDLLNHAWFERLWIHQELVVSSAATAVLQYHTIPFPFI